MSLNWVTFKWIKNSFSEGRFSLYIILAKSMYKNLNVQNRKLKVSVSGDNLILCFTKVFITGYISNSKIPFTFK